MSFYRPYLLKLQPKGRKGSTPWVKHIRWYVQDVLHRKYSPHMPTWVLSSNTKLAGAAVSRCYVLSIM